MRVEIKLKLPTARIDGRLPVGWPSSFCVPALMKVVVVVVVVVIFRKLAEIWSAVERG